MAETQHELPDHDQERDGCERRKHAGGEAAHALRGRSMHLGAHRQEDGAADLEERLREHRLLVARPRQRHGHDRDDARRALREHHDAIGEADGLVDVVRHEQRCTATLLERGLEPRLRVEAGLRVERGQGSSSASTGRSASSVRTSATRWRMPPESAWG